MIKGLSCLISYITHFLGFLLGSLPTYKVLNLLEDGFFGDSDEFSDEDEDEDEYPKWSSFNLYQKHEQ